MRLLELIKKNFGLLVKTFVKVISFFSAIISFILLFFERKDLGIDNIWTAVTVILVVTMSTIIISIFWVLICYQSRILCKDPHIIKVQYGDIWKQAFPKKNTSKRIIVIAVNTTFDVIVDDGTVKKPLVTEKSVHGQWIKKIIDKGIKSEEMSKKIQDNLIEQGVQPLRVYSETEKTRGERKCYERGTIAVFSYANTIFYLLALSEFDDNNNAQNTKEDFIKVFSSLINFYNMNGQGYELFLTLMGTGMSRTCLSHEESLRLSKNLLEIYKDKLRGNVTIMVYNKDKDKLSLDV